MNLESLPRAIRLLVHEIYDGLKDSQIQLLSSSLTFTSLFALVPFIAIFLSVFKTFGGVQPLFDTFEPLIMSYLAPGSGEAAIGVLRSAISRAHSTTMGTTGFIFLVISSMRLMIDIENAFQKIWQVKKHRSWINRILIYWGMIFFGPLVATILIGLISARIDIQLDFLPPQAISLFCLFSVLFLLYKVVPPTYVDWRHALISAAVAGLSIIIAKEVYQMSTAYMITYNEIYGSLATIPFFLLWLLIIWWIILGGAILASAIKRFR